MWPWKRPPTSCGSGWVNRVPSVRMMTTKSVPVSTLTRSAKGCRAASGARPWTAVTTSGVAATAVATAETRAVASRVCERSVWRYAPASPAATTTRATRTRRPAVRRGADGRRCRDDEAHEGAPVEREATTGLELAGAGSR